MSIINCPNCGNSITTTISSPASRSAARRVGICSRCRSSRTTAWGLVPVEPVGSGQHMPPPGARSASGPRVADVIDYEIFGNEMQFAEITLDPGEMVIAEAGAMMYMTTGIKMETVFGDPSQQKQGFWGKVMSAGKRRDDRRVAVHDDVHQRRAASARSSPSPRPIRARSFRCISTSSAAK